MSEYNPLATSTPSDISKSTDDLFFDARNPSTASGENSADMFANFPEADCFMYAFVLEIRATPSAIDARACASCALREAEFPPPAAAMCATAESPRKMSAPPSSASSLSTSTISEDTYL